MSRTCTAHADNPVEAETEVVCGQTYVVLRCPRSACGRVRGSRLVRKVK